ncbi:apolipoprotein N-acyltransferase [Actinoallomurus liliacearum]|uniref:Apolipoprotein N-acyltransferase n=1 Tax=Actinoallomurus liliacearum TaxID=1080073 RepID=A0ABP8TV97_9ACTN
MRTAAERTGSSDPAPDERPPAPKGARARPRLAALAAGALPVLAFPRAGLDWFAWVALVPGLLVVRSAATGREAAVRGWWFGAGFLAAALYWLIPNIGPALALVATGAGVLWAGWGFAAWALLRPGRLLAALVVVPSVWVAGEWARSWHALGGPWALYGATQWRHPAVLSLASLGGVWLVTFALVAVNTAVAMVLVTRSAPVAVLATLIALSGPALYTPSSEAVGRPMRIALVQPGVVDGPDRRFADGERITSALPAADLVVWGESSVGFDLDRRPDLVARLTALARAHGPLLVNEDARDASGRIAKSAVFIGPDGVQGRYVKNRLVPFGEYIPLRRELGWVARISEAAKEDRLPGTGLVLMRAGGGPDAVTFAPLVCFESAFPDLSRAVARRGARLIVYESATSTFQDSWAPAQHASLGAVRAAETGRPVVQAALTGVSAAFDAKGRRLAWSDTSRRGSVLVEVVPAGGRTPYDRFGDYVAWLAVGVVLVSGAFAVRTRRGR